MASLEMRNNSSWWYGRYRHKGKTYVKNLGIKIRGDRPESIKGVGSPQFENSKGEAKQTLDKLAKDVKGQGQAEELAQAVYEARTGTRVGAVPISKLSEKWLAIPRKRKPSDGHRKHALGVIGRFVTFLGEHHPNTLELHEVTREIAQAFMSWEEARGVSAKTWNESLSILKTACKKLKHDAGLAFNPFDGLVQKEVETVFREPYTPDELKAVLDASEADPFIRPIMVTAACTAMRRGDCCLLRWKEVDLAEGFVTVKTSKTGQTVDIPLFPMLQSTIAEQAGQDDEFVFPAQAEKYMANPGYLTARLRKVLDLAGFRDGPTASNHLELPEATAETVRHKVNDMLAGLPATARTERMSKVFDAYTEGRCVADTAATVGCAKSTVSLYLNEIEQQIGIPFIRGKARATDANVPTRGAIHMDRENGLRRGSLRDWHSFRTTWITLALASDIPLEIVRKVTGHKTVEVVLKHYFRPQREQLKKILQAQMPALLTDGAGTTVDQALDALTTGLEAAPSLKELQKVVREAVALLQGKR